MRFFVSTATPQGTRLTAIDKIVRDSDVIKAYCSETIFSAGELLGSDRKCTFTGVAEMMYDFLLIETANSLKPKALKLFIH